MLCGAELLLMALQKQNVVGDMGPTAYERNQEDVVQLRVPGQMKCLGFVHKAKSMGLSFAVVQVAQDNQPI